MMTTLTREETRELIQGPAGKLELITALPDEPSRAAWGIVCHPHPLFGGTMHNKVVTTLAKTFQQMGLNTIRFNFRGVGLSEGQFDHGIGELEDLLAVMSWAQQTQPQEIWLAGFSFGAYVATRAATQMPVKKLVAVAPAVQHFPMASLPPVLCPWILVQGDRDDVVSPEAVYAFAEQRDPKPVILRFPEAGHFFHGLLGELRTRVTEALLALG